MLVLTNPIGHILQFQHLELEVVYQLGMGRYKRKRIDSWSSASILKFVSLHTSLFAFRLQYIQDVVLPTHSVFEENMLSTLSSLIFFNKVRYIDVFFSAM